MHMYVQTYAYTDTCAYVRMRICTCQQDLLIPLNAYVHETPKGLGIVCPPRSLCFSLWPVGPLGLAPSENDTGIIMGPWGHPWRNSGPRGLSLLVSAFVNS